jgi:hypothetical protein
MRAWHHLYLFYLGTTFWALFFLGGLGSDYYQRWDWRLCLVVVVILPTLMFYVLGRQLLAGLLRDAPRPWAAGAMAFHVTVPLAIYDGIYLGWHQGLGAGFVVTHWYLSVLYVIPWLMVPLIARGASHDANPRARPAERELHEDLEGVGRR